MCSERDKGVLEMIMNPNLPFNFGPQNTVKEDDDNHYLNLTNYQESELHNMEGIKIAESGDYSAAMAKFNEAIKLCPENPSSYNNRAQLYRLESNISEALTDLEKSLELSKGRGRKAAQSFVQMALIHRLRNEDMARKEFEKAAELGSVFAKQQLVAMNPYAAMCNQMLSEIMTKFRRGE